MPTLVLKPLRPVMLGQTGLIISLFACRNRFAVVRTPRGRSIDRGRKSSFADRHSGRQNRREDRAYRDPQADRAGWASSPASSWTTSESAQWSERATQYVSPTIASTFQQPLHGRHGLQAYESSRLFVAVKWCHAEGKCNVQCNHPVYNTLSSRKVIVRLVAQA